MSSASKNEPEAKGERERPVLQFSVMCDAVATPKEIGNKPVFIGVFANLLRPSVVPQFFVANRWINGSGEHVQMIRILKPDLQELVKAEQKFTIISKVMPADIFSGFVNINFDSPGVYWLRVELDGQLALAYPVAVLKAS